MLTGAPNAIPDVLRVAPDVKADRAGARQRRGPDRRPLSPRCSRHHLPLYFARSAGSLRAPYRNWRDLDRQPGCELGYRCLSRPGRSSGQPADSARLSPKETAIITCITQGKRNKEIAFQLGTTEQVIKNYLRKIYDKLGVSDRLELALYCLHNKIIKSDADEVVVAQKIVAR